MLVTQGAWGARTREVTDTMAQTDFLTLRLPSVLVRLLDNRVSELNSHPLNKKWHTRSSVIRSLMRRGLEKEQLDIEIEALKTERDTWKRCAQRLAEAMGTDLKDPNDA